MLHTHIRRRVHSRFVSSLTSGDEQLRFVRIQQVEYPDLRVGLTVSLLAMRNNRQSSRATTAGNTLRSRGLVVFMARCMHVPVSVRRYHTLIELKVEKSGLLTEKFRVITSQPVVCEKA